MSGSRRQQELKAERNQAFADKYRQARCSRCANKSSKPGRCRACGSAMIRKGPLARNERQGNG